MRSKPYDDDGYITAMFVFGTGAATASGVAQPGAIPFIATSGGTGIGILNFDPAYMPVGAAGSTKATGAFEVRFDSYGSGTIRCITTNSAGTLANDTVTAHITLRRRS